MAFTKVVGPGIHTLAQLRTHNIHSAGIITATRFVGEIGAGTGSTSTFTNVNITGNLTVQGDQTTLNTTLRNVELLRVASNSATTAGIITQTGAGDILNLFDATSEVVTVTDGGKVGIGTTNPTSLLEIFGGDVKIGSAGQTVGYGVTISSQYGQIKFPDGETGGTKIGNLSFGDGADFRIVHDQHHNYLTAYNGDIYLGTASHTPLRVKQSSASVELWYAGGKTLETVSGGVKVTGNTNALQVQSTGEVQVVIGSTNAGGAGIYFDGDSNGDWTGSDYSHILHNTSGDMEYNADNPGGATNHIFKTAGGEKVRIDSDGNIILKDGAAQGNSLVNYIKATDSSGNSQYQYGMLSNGNQDLYIENSKNANIRIRTNGSTRWKIDGDPGHLLPETAGAVNIGSSSAEIGHVYAQNVTLKDPDPSIFFVDSDNNPDYHIVVNSGHFMIKDTTASADRLYINASSTTITNNLNANAGVDVTGEINLTSELNFTGNGHKYIDVATLNGGHSLSIRHQDGSSYETGLTLDANGAAKLFHNGDRMFQTDSQGAIVYGPEAGDAHLYLFADEGDDDADKWRFVAYPSTSKFLLQNKASGSWITSFQALGGVNGVTLAYNNNDRLVTTNTGATISGSLLIEDTGEYQIVLKDNNNAGQGAEMAMGFKDSANTVQGWVGFNKWEDDDFHTANTNDGGHLIFHTHNGTSVGERLRITSAGLVGIGEDTPLSQLEIGGATNATFQISPADGNTGESRIFIGGNSSNQNKCAIIHDPAGGYCRGNLHFCLENSGDTSNVDSSDSKMVITSAGRVGINETSPDSMLHIKANNDRSAITLENTYDNPDNVWELNPSISGVTNTGFCIRDVTDSANRLVIDGSGRILIGTSVSRQHIIQCHLQVEGTSQATSSLSLCRNSNDVAPPNLIFAKSRGGSVGSNTVVNSGDWLAYIAAVGADGTDTDTESSSIRMMVDGTPGSNDMPGRFEFWTTPDGSNSPDQRLRISSKGTITAYRSDSFATHMWSTVHEGPDTNGNYGLYRHVGYISAGSSTATINLMRVRRHYWGMGHYKITLKQTYYSATPEATWFLNGHGRNNSSFTPNWGLTHYNNNSSHTSIGSGTLQVTAASNSSPGNDYATYTDVQAVVSAYNHFIVVIEASGGAAFSTDITSISNDGYALH